MKPKTIGWKYQHEDLYTASLILTEKKERVTIEVTIEPLKPWRPVEKVSEKVVRRRRDGSHH